MKQFIGAVFAFFAHLGGFGLLGLGILDSTFLVMPLGNDLLVVALTARAHERMPYYAAMATAGSVLGCFFMDLLARRGGEAGLARRVPPKRLEYVKRKVSEKAGWGLAFASLMPPPFPFTPFVIAASALQYPRKRLLAVIGVSRFVRFLGDGVLAILFGRRILHLAGAAWVRWAITALIAISVLASVMSVVSWVRRSKRPAARAAG